MSLQKLLLITSIVIGFALQLEAKDPVYTGTFSSVAVGGFDTVSYHEGNMQPIKGSKEFKTQWRGAEWRFSSAENLKKFKADPLAFAPQYGGYCAWAIGEGKLAKGDPKIFKKVDGKLYLNYNKKIEKLWEADRANYIQKADTNYPGLVDLKTQ